MSYSRYVPRILAITHSKEERLIVGQWKSGIIFRSFDNYLGGRQEIGYGKAFTSKSPVLITFSSDKSGSVIYVDGKAVRRSKTPLMHRLSTLGSTAVIANSVLGDQPWSGELYHISIFDRSLSSQEISSRALKTESGITKGEIISFDFTSNPRETVYPNEGSYSQTQLSIPKRFSPPEKQILRPPWTDYSFDKAYFTDVILNFLGFIPSGVLLGLLFRLKGIRIFHAVLISLLISAAISSSIEVLQVFLPTRTSQLSDLILNILGGITGTGAVYFVEFLILEFRANKME